MNNINHLRNPVSRVLGTSARIPAVLAPKAYGPTLNGSPDPAVPQTPTQVTQPFFSPPIFLYPAPQAPAYALIGWTPVLPPNRQPMWEEVSYYNNIQYAPRNVRPFSTQVYRDTVFFRPEPQFHSGTPPRSGCLVDNRVFHGIKNFGYFTGPNVATTSAGNVASSEMNDKTISQNMQASEIYDIITDHLTRHRICKVVWLNRLLAKVQTPADFEKGVEIFLEYQKRLAEIGSETGTLLVKAACRADLPEKALELLKQVDRIRMWPTLGGIHYLMINFSLKKDTPSVLETFRVATEVRNLTPNSRTYHIIIRECVDHDLVDQAMAFAEQSKKNGLIPNRVTYNILMNGCRKHNKAEELLELRKQMEEYKIEINDTTLKFTTLAYLMLKNPKKALETFMSYTKLDQKLDAFSLKFFEMTNEENPQKELVLELFSLLKGEGLNFSPEVDQNLAQLQA